MTTKIKCECGKWIDISDQLNADLQLIADHQAVEIEQLRSSAAGSVFDDYRESVRLLTHYGGGNSTLSDRVRSALEELDDLRIVVNTRGSK
jgi:hypothetical protein